MPTNVIKGNFPWNFTNSYQGHVIDIRYVNLLDCWHLTLDGRHYKFWTLEELLAKLNKEVRCENNN